jgi:uncharacterized cysteine cluster protein YcgN (CxxCxxCC family)
MQWQEVQRFRLEQGRCLNCVNESHWEERCKDVCGKCITTRSFYGSSDQRTIASYSFNLNTEHRTVDSLFVVLNVSSSSAV